MAEGIPVGAPGEEYRAMSSEIDDAIHRVLRSGRYVQGPEHDAFEAEFAAHIGAPEAVAVGNCTDALELAMRSLGVTAGSEVITAANCGGFAASAAHAVGATPVYVDVDEQTLVADPVRISEAIGPRTAVVVVTHLYGRVHPHVHDVVRECTDRGVPVIEDCAQAMGARLDGRHAGTFGHAAAFSFYPTKNLGGLGDGGMVVTRDGELAARLRSLRSYGRGVTSQGPSAWGRNSRLDELQAAVLRVKLRRLDELVERRRAVTSAYLAAAPDRWWCGAHDPGFAAHLAVTRSADRAAFVSSAEIRGIATAVHFDPPDHRRFGASGPGKERLPVTERVCAEVVSLPCHPFLTPEQVARVCEFLTVDGPP